MDDNAALRRDFILKVLDGEPHCDSDSLKEHGIFSYLSTILDLHGVLISGINLMDGLSMSSEMDVEMMFRDIDACAFRFKTDRRKTGFKYASFSSEIHLTVTRNELIVSVFPDLSVLSNQSMRVNDRSTAIKLRPSCSDVKIKPSPPAASYFHIQISDVRQLDFIEFVPGLRLDLFDIKDISPVLPYLDNLVRLSVTFHDAVFHRHELAEWFDSNFDDIIKMTMRGRRLEPKFNFSVSTKYFQGEVLRINALIFKVGVSDINIVDFQAQLEDMIDSLKNEPI